MTMASCEILSRDITPQKVFGVLIYGVNLIRKLVSTATAIGQGPLASPKM